MCVCLLLNQQKVVIVDLDVVKAKHGKSAPRTLPKLYAMALTPILAERSKSELTLHHVPAHMENKVFFRKRRAFPFLFALIDFYVKALNDLLTQERQANAKQYRFGIVRQKYGQTTEDEILSNGTSDEFEQFVSSLGEKVLLKNHKAFKGTKKKKKKCQP